MKSRDGLVREGDIVALSRQLFAIYQSKGATARLGSGTLGALIGVNRSRWTQLTQGKFKAMSISTFLSMQKAIDLIDDRLADKSLPPSSRAAEKKLVEKWLGNGQ